MSFTIDLGFTKNEPKRFGGPDGGLRMTGDDADDVIDSLCEKMNRAITMIEADPSVCRICAVLDPDDAGEHTTEEHPEEDQPE